MGLLEQLGNLDVRDLERAIAIRGMGAEAKRLYDEGYAVDADRVLDELADRLKGWEDAAA